MILRIAQIPDCLDDPAQFSAPEPDNLLPDSGPGASTTAHDHAIAFSMALLGRESEMITCLAALGRTQMPAGIVIVGEPGIGKTTLFRAVVHAALQAKHRVLMTTGLSGEVDAPLASLADLLDPDAGNVLVQLPPVQAHALGVALRLTSATSHVDGAVIVRAAVNVLRVLAGNRLLVAVDDEQWLDPDTRRVLITAVTWLTDAPITWLVSVRAGHADAGLAPILAHELTRDLARVDLAGMDDHALGRLVLDRYPVRWSSRLIHRIFELSAGNPFTALELARETLASTGRDAAAVRVPVSLAGSLNARLQRLSPAVLTVVQAAALTRRPTRQLLRAVVGTRADAAVDVALEADVLSATPPGPVVQFTHPLLREVALASLTWPQRRRLHRALAEAVQDPVEVAGHLAAGADEPDEAIAVAIEKAAIEAAYRGAPAHAATLAEAALALTPDPAGLQAWHRRIRLLDYLERASEVEQAHELAEKWAAENPPAEVLGKLTFYRGFLRENVTAGFELMAQAIGQLDQDPAFAAHTGAQLAHHLSSNGWRNTEAQAHAARAVRNARRASVPAVLRWTLAVEADLAARTGQPDAEALLLAAVALPGWEEMWVPLCSPEMRLAWWHLRRGELDPARQLMQKVRDASERQGGEGALAVVHAYLVLLEWAAGQWDQAERHGVLFDHYTRTGYADLASVSILVHNVVKASRGQTSPARAALDEGLQVAARDHEMSVMALLRGALAQLELSINDPAAAAAWLDPIAVLLPEHAFGEPGMVTIPADLIESYARVGRVEQASRLLGWLQDAADRLDNPWVRITSSRAAAVLHLANGDPKAAATAVEPAVNQARERRLPLELGRCLLVLGTAQRRTRQRRTAAHTLDEAIAVFDELGAQRWTELARAERARLAHTADDILTPAEQRIAELVALGRTNAEIAATLLVTVKTVEGTLTRIYRKLGVRSRVDLARRAGT